MAPEIERAGRDAPAEAGQEPGLGQKLLNEAYVIGSGVAGSFSAMKDSAAASWESPGRTALSVAISGAAGLGLGYLSGRAGALGLIARGAAAAAGISFVYDGVRPWHQALGAAWTARDSQELDQAARQLSTKLGQFVFDTALMTPTAVAGAYAGARLRLRAAQNTGLAGLEPARAGSSVEGLKAGSDVISSGAAAKSAGDGLAVAGLESAEMLGAGGKTLRAKPLRFELIQPGQGTHKRFDYGIEITDPHHLKYLLEKPNAVHLDHHRAGDTASTLSAAEQALALPADKLPRPGAVLATNRADPDSITAMAVLANRNEGRSINARLVEAIGRRDRGLKEPPPGENYDDLRDTIDAINYSSHFPHKPFHEKVFFVKDVLDGSVNQELVATLARRSRDRRRSLHADIAETMKVETIIPDRLAVVESFNSGALSHGYEYAPVVVLVNRNQNFTRISVGTQEGSGLDRFFGRAIRDLNKLEPGWGGRSSMFGSPQNGSTKLTAEEVIAVVKSYINPPAHKRYLWQAVDLLRDTRPFKWVMSGA